jgi:hypothetical protein
MSAYTSSYAIRYSIPSVQQQIEVAVITAAQDIQNEATTTPDHAQRLAWANWASKNSPVAWIAFSWPVSMNATIQGSVQADPSGQSVKDSDVQFVVNSALPAVIADFVANPPPGVTIPPAA